MSIEKKKKPSWGGARKHAGRPRGASKMKISVSVDRENWQTALKTWNGKASGLVDELIGEYALRKARK
jgi:hypothetical protein